MAYWLVPMAYSTASLQHHYTRAIDAHQPHQYAIAARQHAIGSPVVPSQQYVHLDAIEPTPSQERRCVDKSYSRG
jgi:hypothetical protein